MILFAIAEVFLLGVERKRGGISMGVTTKKKKRIKARTKKRIKALICFSIVELLLLLFLKHNLDTHKPIPNETTLAQSIYVDQIEYGADFSGRRYIDLFSEEGTYRIYQPVRSIFYKSEYTVEQMQELMLHKTIDLVYVQIRVYILFPVNRVIGANDKDHVYLNINHYIIDYNHACIAENIIFIILQVGYFLALYLYLLLEGIDLIRIFGKRKRK